MNDTVGNGTIGSGNDEAFIRAMQFWAVPREILHNISFVIYGTLVAYTSAKSFRSRFPQKGPLKLSITYLVASLALVFTALTSQGLRWLPSIWEIIRVPLVVQDSISHLGLLSLPLFRASILEALSHIEGQGRNAGRKKFFAMTFVCVQAAMLLPTLVIDTYIRYHLRTIDSIEPGRTDTINRLFDACEVSMRLQSGVSIFATVFTLVYASSLLESDAPSPTKGTNLLHGIRSWVIRILLTGDTLNLLLHLAARNPRTYVLWQWDLVEVTMIVANALLPCAAVAFVTTLKRFTPAPPRTATSSLIANEAKSSEKCAEF